MDLNGRRHARRDKWVRFSLQTGLVEGELFLKLGRKNVGKHEMKEVCLTYPVHSERGGVGEVAGMRWIAF